MSHCTKFDFSYMSEDAIVKAFRKMNIKVLLRWYQSFLQTLERKLWVGSDGSNAQG